MQLITNKSAVATTDDESSDSDYVGKHRPHRLGLKRTRVRVSQSSAQVPAAAK